MKRVNVDLTYFVGLGLLARTVFLPGVAGFTHSLPLPTGHLRLKEKHESEIDKLMIMNGK